ncbi:MAG: hypothetical protein ACE5H4_13650 [Candidatus Thorarchaeota archaeon]
MRVVRLPRHPKGTRIYQLKITKRTRRNGEPQYLTTPPKRLMEEIISDTEEPYRVGGFVIAKDLLWLIVADEEEE